MREGFSLWRGGFSLRREDFSLRRGDFFLWREDFSLRRGGFSLWREDFSLRRKIFPLLKESLCLAARGVFAVRGTPAAALNSGAYLRGGQGSLLRRTGHPQGLLAGSPAADTLHRGYQR
jgi:hypothetical protein